MGRIQIDPSQVESVIKRAMFLAYTAASTAGMGWMAARDNVTEDQVFAVLRRDTRGDAVILYADYVFGRMMKVDFVIRPGGVIEYADRLPRSDYQSWVIAYPSFEKLLLTAVEQLGVKDFATA